MSSPRGVHSFFAGYYASSSQRFGGDEHVFIKANACARLEVHAHGPSLGSRLQHEKLNRAPNISLLRISVMKTSAPDEKLNRAPDLLQPPLDVDEAVPPLPRWRFVNIRCRCPPVAVVSLAVAVNARALTKPMHAVDECACVSSAPQFHSSAPQLHSSAPQLSTTAGWVPQLPHS